MDSGYEKRDKFGPILCIVWPHFCGWMYKYMDKSGKTVRQDCQRPMCCEDRAYLNCSMWSSLTQESRCLPMRCKGCGSVFCKWAKTYKNLELNRMQPINTNKKKVFIIFFSLLFNNGEAENSPHRLLMIYGWFPSIQFLPLFIQLIPFSLALSLSFSLQIPVVILTL